MVRNRNLLLVLLALLLSLIMTACGGSPAAAPTPTRTPQPVAPGPQGSGTPTAAPTPAPGQPTATPIGPYGPTGFPADVNPLTGLPVTDPAVLNRRPIIVKVSNESPVVRPQSGWAFADHVWEHQMEGFAQTRYTAVFLSQSPERVGSVRSARLPDVNHFVDLYGGILIFSGASSNYDHNPPGPPRVRELILAKPWADRALSEQFGDGPPMLVRIPDVPRPGVQSWHTLFAVPAEIWKWAEQNNLNQRPNLEGLAFDLNPPAGGAATTEATVDYPGIGPKHTWRFDAGTGRWLSWTDDVADTDTLLPEGQQIAFDNVVILYVPHYEGDFLEQEGELGELYGVGFNLTGEGDAVLLRDGQRYTVKWHRVGVEGMLQLTDASGAVIPLKPGTTFFHTVDTVYFAPTVTLVP